MKVLINNIAFIFFYIFCKIDWIIETINKDFYSLYIITKLRPFENKFNIKYRIVKSKSLYNGNAIYPK